MEKNNKIQSLNNVLPEFYLDDMERRLETDPLTMGGLVDLDVDEDVCSNYQYCECNTLDNVCVDKISCGTYQY